MAEPVLTLEHVCTFTSGLHFYILFDTFVSTLWASLDICIIIVGRWDVAEPGLTWERLMQNKNKELDRLNGVYMKLLNNAGVKYIKGRGTLVDAHTVEVGGKQYTVSILAIVLAFGAKRGPLAVSALYAAFARFSCSFCELLWLDVG